jgi:class 3 adenylate cyclase/CheY-like chemotaxis protein
MLRHDLRTPINQIVGYAEMLEEDASAAGQEAVVADLRRIVSAARSLLALVDRIPDELGPEPSPVAAPAPPAAPPAAAHAFEPQPRRPTPEEAAANLLEGSDEPGPATIAGRVAAARTSAGSTLLVVDDNELNRDMLSRRLRSRGYTVFTAEDGQQALDLITARRFDLILLDIMMPVLSGIDVLKILRQTYSVAELPVIMATAKDQGEDIVEALRLGANDYVTKPLDFPVVLARTETQLTLKRAMEEIRRLANQLEKRNRFIKQTFGRYLSEEVVDQLLETPEGTRLGGEKREVTLLMADLRGFTALADRFSPEQIVGMLNNYLGTMADLIVGYQGTIDEFIGDAILAIFGAPVTREDDAERACACAVAMQLAMEGVNEHNRKNGLPEVQMGIAVNTGPVIVGNIGSQTRAKYGVVGTHVNLSGRIEGFTVGGQILVSHYTVEKAGPSLRLGRRLTFEAKGFKEPIAVYDLLGVGGRWNTDLPRRQESLVALHRELPVTISVLEGKHMKDVTFTGALVAASAHAASVRTPEKLPAMGNLRLRLVGVDGRPSPGDLYGKVASDEEAGAYLIRFTSVDPDVAEVLRQAVAAGGS